MPADSCRWWCWWLKIHEDYADAVNIDWCARRLMISSMIIFRFSRCHFPSCIDVAIFHFITIDYSDVPKMMYADSRLMYVMMMKYDDWWCGRCWCRSLISRPNDADDYFGFDAVILFSLFWWAPYCRWCADSRRYMKMMCRWWHYWCLRCRLLMCRLMMPCDVPMPLYDYYAADAASRWLRRWWAPMMMAASRRWWCWWWWWCAKPNISAAFDISLRR